LYAQYKLSIIRISFIRIPLYPNAFRKSDYARKNMFFPFCIGMDLYVHSMHGMHCMSVPYYDGRRSGEWKIYQSVYSSFFFHTIEEIPVIPVRILKWVSINEKK